jgi:hypothetical protein
MRPPPPTSPPHPTPPHPSTPNPHPTPNPLYPPPTTELVFPSFHSSLIHNSFSSPPFSLSLQPSLFPCTRFPSAKGIYRKRPRLFWLSSYLAPISPLQRSQLVYVTIFNSLSESFFTLWASSSMFSFTLNDVQFFSHPFIQSWSF